MYAGSLISTIYVTTLICRWWNYRNSYGMVANMTKQQPVNDSSENREVYRRVREIVDDTRISKLDDA